MTLRVCLDLNVLVANLLARAKGRQGTACQALVAAVRRGRCAAGPVQLVISWGMLDRLEDVLRHQLGIARGTAQRYRASLAALAVAGPSGLPPSLTLGGTGVVPLHDVEDRHVLETALAGRADWLVTANLADFIAPGDDVVIEDRLVVRRAPPRELQLVHPFLAAAWLRQPWPSPTGD
jgi:predicted nucleic acid-binding protein